MRFIYHPFPKTYGIIYVLKRRTITASSPNHDITYVPLGGFSSASIFFLHRILKVLSNNTESKPRTSVASPKIVKVYPSPSALIIGSATMAPTQLKMLRTKLLTATPSAPRPGMNSVREVVARD